MRYIFVRGDSNSVKSSMACSVVSIAKTVMRKRNICIQLHDIVLSIHACMENFILYKCCDATNMYICR